MNIPTKRVNGSWGQCAGILHRQRLVSRLEERSPLTVVRGPAGSGKTTLVNQYLKQHPAPGVVVFTDCSTSTRQDFWLETLKALTEDAPELSAVVEQVQNTDNLPRLLAETFTAAGAELLVIDDVDRCEHCADIEDDVFQLLQDCPQLRAIVTTRTLGYLEGGLVGARVGRTLISPLALMLTPEESSRMIPPVLSESLDVAELHHGCGGSPLLLGAMIAGIQHRAPGETIDQVAFGVVRDLLRSADSDSVDFMLRTCAPEELDLLLARRLSADQSAMDRLSGLVNDGLLVRHDSSGEPVWHYHSIVRQGLLAYAAEHQADQLMASRRTTAQWYLEQGQTQDAVTYALRAQDYGLASDALLADGMQLVFQGDVFDQLPQLDQQQLRRYPLLAFANGLGCYRRRSLRVKAWSCFAAAVEGSRSLSDEGDDAERVALWTLEATSLRLSGEASRGQLPARHALELLRDPQADLSRFHGHTGWLRLENALSLVAAGNVDEAWTALEENIAAAADLPPPVTFQTMAAVAYLHASAGDITAADEAVGAAARLDVPASVRTGHRGALYRLARGLIALESFDTRAARQEIQRLEDHMETVEVRAPLIAMAAVGDLLSGHAARGLQRIAGYVRRVRHSGEADSLLSSIVPAQAILHMADGHSARAQEVLSAAPTESAHSFRLLLSALASHLAGDPAAESPLVGFDATAVSLREAALAQLILASAACRRGDSETSVHHLRHLLELMADNGLRSHLALLPRQELDNLHKLASSSGCEHADLLTGERVPNVMPPSRAVPQLTDRELVVLHGLARHAKVADIAQSLVVSHNTVKTQLRSVYRKLDAVSREQAVSAAYRHGLLRRQQEKLS